ncbi:MAG TPA: DUF4339 domain-containing protein [Chthoniobacterales bacterium]|nr:DUF4339 domain-containing protein [Chthoniobacterales bacterium]
MNSFENNQSEAWIVRVQGKEYGPVDLDELREWKREGRLIRENEIREPGSEHWIKAGEFVEIFGDEVEAAEPTPPPVIERRSFGWILAEGWRVYRAGFGRFFLLALLVSVPSFFLQLAAPFLEMPKEGGPTSVVIGSALVVFAMLALLVVAWPFSLAGMQLLAADLFAGRNPGLREILSRAKPLWMRMFLLGLIVYGSYFLWTIIPLLVALSLAAGPLALGSVALMLSLLFFALYMVARLFINFLFWQQAGALGGGETIDSLRESKELARSGTELPRLQRPLYRGALIASLWLLVIIFFNVAIELPVVLYRMRGVTSLEQAATLLQTMATKSTPDFLAGLTTFLSSLIHAILRPWLAAVFVVLYLATKANQQKRR